MEDGLLTSHDDPVEDIRNRINQKKKKNKIKEHCEPQHQVEFKRNKPWRRLGFPPIDQSPAKTEKKNSN